MDPGVIEIEFMECSENSVFPSIHLLTEVSAILYRLFVDYVQARHYNNRLILVAETVSKHVREKSDRLSAKEWV